MLNVKNIIKSAGTMLGIDELKSLSSTEQLDDRTQAIINDMLYCFNEVYQELLADYFPIIIEEEAEADASGYINFSSLSKTICRLYAILDKNRQSLNYVVLNNRARLYNKIKDVIVRYSYIPALASSINDTIECATLGVSERIVALGVACNYCLMRGKITEASIYEQKYKNSIESAKMPTKYMRLKPRRWM